MQILQGKKIVLGISGGIAAYKIPELVRRLKDHGADIRVVMTEGAKAFITPLTLQAVSGNHVSDSLLDSQAELAMGHIELAKWADLILIAPATADIIARITAGMANDLLTTICLATPAPIAIAPAMNQQMWHAPVTCENIDRLTQRGFTIWGPGSGEQACGDIGLGRMLDVDDLVTLSCNFFADKFLQGQHWLITAGPTREAIDPVRYISNHSSGKMGYAIADAALKAGVRRQQSSDGNGVVDLWQKNIRTEECNAQTSVQWDTGKSSKWKPAEDNDLDDGSQITSKLRSYSVMVYW
jgi:phosphopantothenoylcysteine decarboxylase/phosphopantothenate--cysteine ligase